MGKKKIKVLYDKNTCIGCSACVSIADDYWDFPDNDSDKVDLLSSKTDGDDIFTREGKDEDEERLIECQSVCPTESINVEVEEEK